VASQPAKCYELNLSLQIILIVEYFFYPYPQEHLGFLSSLTSLNVIFIFHFLLLILFIFFIPLLASFSFPFKNINFYLYIILLFLPQLIFLFLQLF